MVNTIFYSRVEVAALGEHLEMMLQVMGVEHLVVLNIEASVPDIRIEFMQEGLMIKA